MGTNLKFVKATDINMIPRYLFEQVKPAEYDIDRLYEWAPTLLNNPMNLLGVFIDKEEAIKGVMWSSYNPISNKIQVHILSMDRAYQGGPICKEVAGILEKLKKKIGASGIVATTTRPKAIERKFGFSRSQSVIMEK